MVVFFINDVFTNFQSFKLEGMKFIHRILLNELSDNTGTYLVLLCADVQALLCQDCSECCSSLWSTVAAPYVTRLLRKNDNKG